jgi:hypothetical protein
VQGTRQGGYSTAMLVYVGCTMYHTQVVWSVQPPLYVRWYHGTLTAAYLRRGVRTRTRCISANHFLLFSHHPLLFAFLPLHSPLFPLPWPQCVLFLMTSSHANQAALVRCDFGLLASTT